MRRLPGSSNYVFNGKYHNEYFLLVASSQSFLFNLLAQLEDAFDQCLGTGRATRNIDIHRHNRIDTLHGVVTIIEFAARVCTLTHTDDPLRLWHLLPQ